MKPVGAPNLADPRFKANPFPYYASLRREAPVHRVVLPDKQQAWLITRYADVLAVLKDVRFVKSRENVLSPAFRRAGPWMPAMFRPLSRNMLDLDPPDHTRLRSLVQKAFTPRFVDLMQVRVQSFADELVSAIRGRSRDGMDIIADYALPLPTIVIAEMIGVPVADRGKFHRWSNAIVTAGWSRWSMIRSIPSVMAFVRYIRRLTALKRAQPADDLLTALVTVRESGDQMNDDELLAMVFLLLVAGHETTVNLIGNGMLALIEHPDEMRRLRGEPGIIKSAVEELLRYGGPLETATERYAREDIVIAGTRIPAGALVFAVLASANRDEEAFSEPDRLDLGREPNRHLSFGFGIHHCLGAALARMEGQIAFQTLLREFNELRLATPASSLRWRRGLVLRGLRELPVTYERVAT
jgi:cytochrome P450 PksS